MRNSRFDRPVGGRARYAGLIACVSALSLTACAQTNKMAYQSYAGVNAPRQQVAVAAPPKLETEIDGLPVQHPPVLRRGRVPDDPAEPFSPNYGPPEQQKSTPSSAPVDNARKAALSKHEAEGIIARAVAAHEIRTQ